MMQLINASYEFVPYKRIRISNILLGRREDNQAKPFKALNNINLKIENGDRIGLMGANGSGKSTLLRMISGIYKESSGQVIRDMSTKCLLDKKFLVSTDLPGTCAAKAEFLSYFGNYDGFDEFLAEIFEFSGLKEFIDIPMSKYSDGMRVRLLFFNLDFTVF